MFGESVMQFEKIDRIKTEENNSILINTYLKSEYAPEYNDGYFFIEFKKTPEYSNYFTNFIENHESCVDSYDIKNHTVYVFKIPFSQEYNYRCFIRSKFSRINDNYKTHILRFHNLNFKSRLALTLYKDPSLYKIMEEELGLDFEIDRSQEIGSLLNLDDEIHKKVRLEKLIKKELEWD